MPHQASWTLVRVGTGLSGAWHSSAFQFACSALDGLEAQLASEEYELNNVRVELERAPVRLLEMVECCRQGDGAAHAQREEAHRFAEEVCKSAAREAEELLAPVQAERSALAEDRAAAAADRAATEAALATREAKIVEDFESIRRSLDQYCERLEARERALATPEAELVRREEQVVQADLDLTLQRKGLEAREGSVAQVMTKHEVEVARHKGHVKKADERLARKKPDQDKEHKARLKTVREQVSQEYASKFKKQEVHFKKRSREDGRHIHQLDEMNATLWDSNRRAKEARDQDPGGPRQPDC